MTNNTFTALIPNFFSISYICIGTDGMFCDWQAFSLCMFVALKHFVISRSNGEKNPRVKHYQIRQTETGQRAFYLAEKYLFSTIPELIHYHQHNAAGTFAVRMRHSLRKMWRREARLILFF